MLNKVLLWGILIIPWLSLFFMSRDSIRRYMPVGLFVSLLVTILFEVAYTFKWWIMLDGIVPWGYISNVSFIYGAFLVGTIWIFHFTFHRWWLYFVVNVVIDALFAFVLNNFFESLHIYRLVNFNQWQVFLIMLSLAVVIYIYQAWQQGIWLSQERLGEPYMYSNLRNGFGRRKAK